jgi:hypothetical protein
MRLRRSGRTHPERPRHKPLRPSTRATSAAQMQTGHLSKRKRDRTRAKHGLVLAGSQAYNPSYPPREAARIRERLFAFLV